MKEPYTIVSLPNSKGLTMLGLGGFHLNSELIEWLRTNIGQDAPSSCEWHNDLETQEFQWFYSGLYHNSSGLLVRTFFFRHEEDAALFKVRWTGV